ncbi:MAG: O-antigen ligase family protein [Candidatus Uhrbacteria bacterium]
MYLFLVSILIIIYAVIAWKNLRLAVFLIFACLPAYLLRLEILGLPTTFLEMMIGVVTIGWLIHLTPTVAGLWRARPTLSFARRGGFSRWFIPISVLAIAGIIGIVVAPDKMAALGIFKAFIVEPILFFFIVRSTLKWYGDAEKACLFLGLGALAVALLAIFQHFSGLSIPIPWDVEGRTTSLFPYPNAVGLYLGPIIVLGLNFIGKYSEDKFYSRAWFWLLVSGASLAAIIFSQTEAAWLAVPATILLFVLFNKKSRWLSAALMAATIILVFLIPNFREKVLLQDYSGSVRLKQWTETVAMLKDNWLLGAGLSGYPTALAPYHTHEEIEIFQYPHNIILNIWSELGLLGLLAFATFLWQTVWSIRESHRRQSTLFWITLASATALAEMLIHGLVDVPFFKNDLALLTAGLLAILAWSATGPYAHPEPKPEPTENE